MGTHSSPGFSRPGANTSNARGLRRPLVAACSVALAVTALAMPLAGYARAALASQQMSEIRIAAGPRGASYAQVAQRVAERLRESWEGPVVVVDELDGSLDNLRLLYSGGASFAIAQADVLAASMAKARLGGVTARGGSGVVVASSVPSPSRPVFVVAPLHTEVLYLVVRSPLRLRAGRSLAGQALYCGGEGSGTAFTVSAVLDTLGVPVQERLLQYEGPDAALRRLACASSGAGVAGRAGGCVGMAERPRPDVIAVVDLPGSPVVHDLLEPSRAPQADPIAVSALDDERPACATYLHSLGPSDVKQIIDGYPVLVPVRVRTAEAFRRTDGSPEPCAVAADDLHTVGVRAVLVASDHTSTEAVQGVLAALYPSGGGTPADLFAASGARPGGDGASRPAAGSAAEHADALRRALSGASLAELRRGLGGIPLHPETSRFLRGQPWWRTVRWGRVAWMFAGALLLVIALVVGAVSRQWLGYVWHRSRGLVLLAGDLTVLAACALATYLLESTANSNFSNLYQSIWSMMTWLLSGFEDRPPLTAGGRVGSVLFLASWAVLIVLLINYVLKERLRSLLEEDHIPARLRGHHVVCGWNERALGILYQLHRDRPDDNPWERTAVVIAPLNAVDAAKGSRTLHGGALGNVIFKKAEPTERLALLQAGVLRAASVTVLADDRLGTDADAHTCLVLGGLGALLRDTPSDRVGSASGAGPRVVAEVLLSANANSVRRMAAATGRRWDVVDAQRVETHVLAQGARAPGLVPLFFDMLTVSPTTHELYVERGLQPLHGLSFYGAALLLSHLRSELHERLLPRPGGALPGRMAVTVWAGLRHPVALLGQARAAMSSWFRRGRHQPQGASTEGGQSRSLRFLHVGWGRLVPEDRLEFLPVGMSLRAGGCMCVWPPPARQRRGRPCERGLDGPACWEDCDLLVLAKRAPRLGSLLGRPRIRALCDELRTRMSNEGTNG